jgi:hypothetical protein
MPNMTGPSKIVAVFSVALGLLAAPAVGTCAAEVLLPATGGAVGQNSPGELRALENRLQRQHYQQQQQRFRNDDRLSIPLNRSAPQVPIMKPGCQVRVYGNSTVRDCR